MKNLMIYITPRKNWNEEVWKEGVLLWKNEPERLVKIQIDNSLDLGWKPEDILLITNFPYEHGGIKAMVFGDELFFEPKPTVSKINVIVDMFKRKMINDFFWFHDLDAFQLEEIKEEEVGLKPKCVGITDYGIGCGANRYGYRWSTGSIFFRPDTEDVFQWIQTACYYYQRNEEIALLAIMRRNRHRIQERIQKLNITYNLATRRRNIFATVGIADKPIRVLHFHPLDVRRVQGTRANVAYCIGGENEFGKPLVPDRFIKHFKNYFG